jgi:hypothetical protein
LVLLLPAKNNRSDGTEGVLTGKATSARATPTAEKYNPDRPHPEAPAPVLHARRNGMNRVFFATC